MPDKSQDSSIRFNTFFIKLLFTDNMKISNDCQDALCFNFHPESLTVFFNEVYCDNLLVESELPCVERCLFYGNLFVSW